MARVCLRKHPWSLWDRGEYPPDGNGGSTDELAVHRERLRGGIFPFLLLMYRVSFNFPVSSEPHTPTQAGHFFQVGRVSFN